MPILNVLLAIHMIACVALVIAVMLQRSEGGALGMGGGGTGGLISGRGAAGVLVNTTMGLAAVFFTTSIVMTRLNAEQAKAPTAIEKELQDRNANVFDPLAAPKTDDAPATTPAPAAPTTTVPVDPLAPVVTAPTTPTPSAPTVLDNPAPSKPAPKPAPAPTTTQSTAPATQTPATQTPPPASEPVPPT
jgi:preprotein translocase subunit SecG